MINRKFLYWGVFLVAAGGVLLVAQSAIGAQAIEELLRMWPLLVIGLGAGLLLRYSRIARVSLAGGVIAAAMPGLVLGALVAEAPAAGDFSMDCRIADVADYDTREGAFTGFGTVDVTLDCGDVTITSVPGKGWQVQTGDIGGPAPVVNASGEQLTVESAREPRHAWNSDGDSFRISIPREALLDLRSVVNAGRGEYDLVDGQFGDLQLDVNAGEARVDLTGATVAHLAMDLNAASATVRLPATGDLKAEFDVNAAALVICAPDTLGLRIQEDATLSSSTYNGLVRSGNAWQSPDYASASSHADVTISANVGSVDVNPVGGCK
jgi:hypothetical protein